MKKNRNNIFCLFAAMMLAVPTLAQHMDKTVTQYVNPFIGTGAVDDSSLAGANTPAATTPFGMVQLGPDVAYCPNWEETSGYDYSKNRIYGFTHTHLSGTGCASLCDIMVMPTTLSLNQLAGRKTFDYSQSFSHKREKATPGYYSVQLDSTEVQCEFTATTYTGMHRYTFPKGKDNVLVFDVFHSVDKENGHHRIFDSQLKLINPTTLVGFRIMNDWQRIRKVYFCAKFSRPVSKKLFMHWNRQYWDGDMANGTCEHCFLQFDETGEPLIVKVGISPNSIENAEENLKDNPGWNFDAVRQQAHEQWEKEMANIRIDGTDEQKTIFYTGLYHAYFQPNTVSDMNGDYMRTDYETGHLAPGECHYSTFSLWDTYRAAHPLYTLLQPNRVAHFVKSMLRQYDTYGYLPIWQLWGTENYCMIGNHAIPVMVDAALKRLPGVDAERVFEAVKGTQLREHTNSPWKIYEQYGYMPENLQTQSVSITLEDCYDDACVARLAKALGHAADYEHFNKRAHFYRNLFDKSTGFFRAKDDKGNWLEPFNPLAYGGNGGYPFTEGNAWQYLWYVPQDVPDFISLFGGAKNFGKKLDTFFTLETDNTEKNGNASGFIGQYAHGNEPSQHCIYLYNYINRPERAAYYADKVMREQYTTGVGGYSGNDDCGQMSSWYIFSSMGFYPTDPANGRYDFGSPQLPRVEITLPGGKKFTIITHRKNPAQYVIKSIKLNGKFLKRHYVTHEEIVNGGTLEFVMGAK